MTYTGGKGLPIDLLEEKDCMTYGKEKTTHRLTGGKRLGNRGRTNICLTLMEIGGPTNSKHFAG
jgi:hypothetical protein